jgi:hypothetical protein
MGHRRPPFRHSRSRSRIRLICVSESTSAPAGRSSTLPPTTRSPNGRSATSRPQLPPAAARTLLDKLLGNAPFKVSGIQVDGGSEFMSVFEDHCRDKGLELRRPAAQAARPQRSRRTRPSQAGATSSTPATTRPRASTSSSPSSTPSPTDTITTDPWRSHPREYRNDTARRPSRLISAEPGHCAWIIPCGARKSSARSCANTATPHPTRRRRAGRGDCVSAIGRRSVERLAVKSRPA